MVEITLPFYRKTSGFISSADLRVDNSKVFLSAKRIKPRAFALYRLMVILSFVLMLALVICIVVALGSGPRSESEAVGIIMAIALCVLLFVFTLVVVVTRWWIKKKHSYQYEVTFPLEAVSKVRVGYNWDTGCALWILLSPLVAVPYLLISGRKIIKITAPFERGGTESVTYALKAPNKNETTRLMEALQSNKKK